MWIFNKDGFFSVVQKPDQKGTEFVTVRSRSKKDLKNLIYKISTDIPVKIDESSGTDYEYRIVISKKDLGQYMWINVQKINYDNFKNVIAKKNKGRALIYSDIWLRLLSLVKTNSKQENIEEQ